MPTTQAAPILVQSFRDSNGNPLAGGQLYTYVAGTSTPQSTYIDATGTTANANPVVLNSRGEAPVWMTIGQSYKFVLYDAFSTLIYSVDQVAATNPIGTPIALTATGITGAAASGANIDITSLGNNTSTVYTTGGTLTAYTITPAPVYTAYAAGMSFVVSFNAISGASPTLQINGIATPPSIVKQNADGTYSNIAAGDITVNHRSRVTLISTTQALVERLPIQQQGGAMFSAYSSTSPTLGTGVFTKPPFDTKDYDLTTTFNTTLSRFTPGLPGYYQIQGTVRMSGSGVSEMLVSIYKNGVEFIRSSDIVRTADTVTTNIPFAAVVVANATDYFEIYVYVTGTASLTFIGGSVATSSRVQGFLVRGL